MKLLYVNEHLTCRNYVSDFHIGFQYKEEKANQSIEQGNKYYNYIIFLLEGELTIKSPDTEVQTCKGGEMFFIGQSFTYTLEPQTDVKYIILAFDNPVNFNSELTMEELQEHYTEESNKFKILLMCEGMLMVADSIKFYMQHKIQCKHLHAAKQEEVFMMLGAFYNKDELAEFFSPILNNSVDFKSFIMNNYQDVKTVEELARLCNSSVRSLTRKFHEHFGDSPYSWMLKQRSKHIKTRIADPKVSFAEIIHEFGFSSPAHFTSFCKKYFGDSPSQLRKKQTEKTQTRKSTK